MDDVLLRSRLAARGVSDGDLAQLVSAGELQRIRRGAYARSDETLLTPEQAHRLLIAATMPQLTTDAVLSHGSGGVLHTLPVWPYAIRRVHLTRPREGGGKLRSILHQHSSALDEDEITRVDDLLVTVPARTVVDIARTVPLAQGVAAADRALALGLDPPDLQAAVRRAAGWPGIGRARQVEVLADGRSESVGESVSRVLLADLGMAPEDIQLDIFDGRVLVGRVDFAWPERKVLAEFDGRVKYGRMLRDGDDVGQVVWREKLREDALRDLGWEVVRWIWADLDHPQVIVDRLERAFRRAHR